MTHDLSSNIVSGGGVNGEFQMMEISKAKKSALLIALFLISNPALAQSTSPYYGFYPSVHGEYFKRFEHNTLGFSIDIPQSWTFGIHGEPPLTVAVIYPDGMNTMALSDNYEMLEIGKLLNSKGSLPEFYEDTMAGMRSRHASVEIIEHAEPTRINGHEALQWAFTWLSKTGYIVLESVSLVKYESEIRSITV